MTHPCPECGRKVEWREGHMGKDKFARHACPHGRLCIGASIHAKGATDAERRLYCKSCAEER